MAAKPEGFISERMSSSPPSTFQLQTSTIRNSAPFKTKSADVFGSLDTMERDYNSTVGKREIDVGGAKADDEKEAEEGCIKRGCIFKKPQGSLVHKALADAVTQTADSSSSEVHGVDKASSPYLRSPGKHASVKHGATTSGQLGSTADRRDNTSFRRPDRGAWRNVGRRGRGTSNPRGRHHPADHVLNPNKYTKYSLEETNMCGNSANRSVALGFLSELRKRKQQGDNQTVQESGTTEQLVFQKPRETRTLDQAEQPSKKSYGSVYKMPKYEVGKASAPKNKKPKISSFWETAGMNMEDELGNPRARPVINLDHFENEQSMDKEDDRAQSVSQSDLRTSCSNPPGPVDTDKPEQSEAAQHEGGTFKSKKGKGKRHFRGRQEDT
ncbi:uncharacterized protein LOC119725895 [Patiria miniata]|uniref:U5 small nuclear ribonucleoprotein TSSC4 n=1 Tax=Patiria miniata TaxID=46514 RepID=A0A913ZNP8_PATMI|nr:uncharacterized protein LOC119725895 [Patiria miniata]